MENVVNNSKKTPTRRPLAEYIQAGIFLVLWCLAMYGVLFGAPQVFRCSERAEACQRITR